MGKQKYPTEGGAVTTTGERKQRNYNKSGKLAKRREARRLEAIGRQVERVQKLEQRVEKAKDKGAAQKAVILARLTLQQIRGGVPHKELIKRLNDQMNEEQTKS